MIDEQSDGEAFVEEPVSGLEARLREMQAHIDEIYRRIPPTEEVAGDTSAPPPLTPGAAVLVKLSSNATGGGWYNGVIWNAPSTAPSGSSNLTEAQVGSSGASVIVCNLAEVTKATHDIKFSGSPTPYQFIFTGVVVTADDDTTFVAIYAAQWGCG